MSRVISNLLAVASALLLLAVPAVAERWSVEKAREWYGRQPWLVGCNFLPSTAVNDVEMWQRETFDPKTIDRELDWAEDLGFNTVRVFVNYAVWEADAAGLKQRFDRFLGIADRHGVRTVPVLFDDCFKPEPIVGKQDEPLPGIHNSQWVQSPGARRRANRSCWPSLERYIKDLITTFRGDRRIVAWDLYNEPSRSLPLLEATFVWAREGNPSQPLTACLFGPREMRRRTAELCDVLSFHNYGNLDSVKAEVKALKATGRPVFCTEWMARGAGSRFATHLPFFKQEKVGCWSWGLVAGRTQTYFPWGSKPGSPEPALWHHDILRRDGTPFDQEEIRTIRLAAGRLLPATLKPLFDFPLRDTCICLGPDGTYYLTGTTGYPTWWQTNEGIRVWRSKDLKRWEPIGLVWTFEKHATWQKGKTGNDGKLRRAIWAPEIHYFKNTFWLAYCVNYGGTGVLKSTSGKAGGPYVDIKPDGPLTPNIDASLLADDDGKVYFVWQNGMIARMKDDMTGLAETPRHLRPANAPQVGFEGAFLTKINGQYHLICAEFNKHGSFSTYDCMAATADTVYGPYGDRYLAVPHGGHNMLFKDRQGQWWSTFFGNDPRAPFRERPAMLRIEVDTGGQIHPVPETGHP